jgi:hypothetical protein
MIAEELRTAIKTCLKQNKKKQKWLAKECNQIPANFSGWISGKRLPPSHRLASSNVFYEKLSDFIGWAIDKVIAQAYNSEPANSLEMIKKGELIVSSDVLDKLVLIAANAEQDGEYLDVILDQLRSYRKNILKMPWATG